MPMPPPPPPGPPPPGPPSLPAFSTGKLKGGGADNRGALLQSIRQGAKLKKAVTVDKSAPMIAGKVPGTNNVSNNDVSRTKPVSATSTNNTGANGLALGGLFAGGMPKLRPTGLRTAVNQSSSNHVADSAKKTSPDAARQNSVSPVTISNVNEVLRRQLAGDIRNRGPPPQPPSTRSNICADAVDAWNSTTSTTTTTTTRSVFNNKVNSAAPPVPVQSSLYQNKNNNSFLHLNQTTTISQVHAPKPISHGKPNVAPKPPPNIPTNKPATPPKKLVMNGRVPVSRAQSMRVPRSPPVAPPTTPPFPPTVNGKDFGTIRGVPTAFHQSQENLSNVRPQPHHHHRNQTLPVNLIKNNAPAPPLLNSRPSVRPPVPPPPSKTGSNINLKAPMSPPPPPPTSAPPPPPPPPHRTSPAPPPPPSHTRPPPAIPTNGPPPPPPVRNSSMRNGQLEFDTRFSNLFHPVPDLPAPMRFRGFTKMYSSKNAVNKQQAPLPPNAVQLGNKLWESSTC